MTLALVTGASRREGIGYEVCRQLAVKGIDVILTARNSEAAEARAEELAVEGLKVQAAVLDVGSPESVQSLAERIARDFGKLDILINNAAGMSPFGEKAASADLETARAVIDATLFGTWRMCQAFLPLLAKSPHPRIVNVSSGAGSHGDLVFGLTTANSMGTSYAVAKAALNALTAKLANEAPKVRINAVCPGFTATFEGGREMGARPVQDGAAGIVWAAMLGDDGPTGGFFRDGKPLPW
jgi:NAD(P)-dependent dehydrogenase (short-subunit alcohol dehydrogenase family)